MEKDSSPPSQIIKLKPINLLTKTPVTKQVVLKPKTIVSNSVVGNTTIRVLNKQGDIVTHPALNGRQIVLKKITKASIQSPSGDKPVQRVLVKVPQTIQQKQVTEKSPSGLPYKAFVTRPVQVDESPATPKTSLKPRMLAQKMIKIDGLPDEIIDKIPPQVIQYIKNLQSENALLKRMLMTIRTETVSISQNLLKVTNDIDKAISEQTPIETPLKRKASPPPSHQDEPEEKKVKRTIRMPKFPIHAIESLSTFEKDLGTPDFYEFVLQRLQAHLKSRNDINQDNLYDSILSSMINADLLGEISFDAKTNSIAPYQICFKSLEKFRELFSKLLNAFSVPKLGKSVDMPEIEEFLQRKILMRGKILQYQKNSEKSKGIRITKVKVDKEKQEPVKKKDDCDGANFGWLDDTSSSS